MKLLNNFQWKTCSIFSLFSQFKILNNLKITIHVEYVCLKPLNCSFILSYLFKLLFVHGRQILPLGPHSSFVQLPHHSSVNIVDDMLHNIMALFGVLSFRISPTITWLVWPSIRRPMFWHLYEYDLANSTNFQIRSSCGCIRFSECALCCFVRWEPRNSGVSITVALETGNPIQLDIECLYMIVFVYPTVQPCRSTIFSN